MSRTNAAKFLGVATPGDTTSDNRVLGNAAFKVAITNTPTTAASTTACAAGVATSGNTGTYNVSSNKVLTVYYSENAGSSYRPITISDIGAGAASAAAATATEVVAALNANAMFATYFLASVSTNHVRITSLAYGTIIKFYVAGSGNTPLGFTQVANGSAAAGTGTAIAIETTVKDVFGNLLPFCPVKVTLFNASSGATQDSTSKIQAVSAGRVISGLITSQAVIESDKDGLVNFYIADTAASAQSVYVGFDSSNSDYVLVALINASRTAVETVAA